MERRSEANPWNGAASPGEPKVYQSPVPTQRRSPSSHIKRNRCLLRQLVFETPEQISDRLVCIDVAYRGIPVRQLSNFSFALLKIQIKLSPLAVAVCLIPVGCVGNFFFAHGFGDTFELDQPHSTALYELCLKFLHRAVVCFFCALVRAGLNQGGELFIRLPLGWVPYAPALHTDGVVPFQQLLIPVPEFPKCILNSGGSDAIPNQF